MQEVGRCGLLGSVFSHVYASADQLWHEHPPAIFESAALWLMTGVSGDCALVSASVPQRQSTGGYQYS